MEKRRNIFMFVADQMRSDMMHHMGCEVSITPNLDQIGTQEGVSFRNAYCQNPVCVPSRCSFLTGWYPHTKGHRTMNFLLDDGDPNVFKSLKDAGYYVYWMGKNHIIPVDHEDEIARSCEYYTPGVEATDKGIHGDSNKTLEEIHQDDTYYSFLKPPLEEKAALESRDWVLVHEAIDLIRTGKLKEPFCLYVSIHFPHPPYTCEEPYYSMFDRNKMPPIRPRVDTLEGKPGMLQGIYAKQQLQNWTDERFQEVRAVYMGMIKRLDDQFGQIVDELKKADYYDNTAVMVFADHGDYTGDYGIVEKSQNTFEDCLTNVPLIIRPAKDMAVKPRISNALVELVDIPATLAELGGFELPYTQFGRSLLHLLEQEEEHKDAVFCEGGRIHGEVQAMEGGHGPESQYWPRLSTQGSEGPEHTKAIMMRSGQIKYVYRLYEEDELYDLEKDPQECTNRIHDPAYEDCIQKCKNRILQFLVETGDFVPNRKDRTR